MLHYTIIVNLKNKWTPNPQSSLYIQTTEILTCCLWLEKCLTPCSSLLVCVDHQYRKRILYPRRGSDQARWHRAQVCGTFLQRAYLWLMYNCTSLNKMRGKHLGEGEIAGARDRPSRQRNFSSAFYFHSYMSGSYKHSLKLWAFVLISFYYCLEFVGPDGRKGFHLFRRVAKHSFINIILGKTYNVIIDVHKVNYRTIYYSVYYSTVNYSWSIFCAQKWSSLWQHAFLYRKGPSRVLQWVLCRILKNSWRVPPEAQVKIL